VEDVVPVATPLRQKVRMGTRIGFGWGPDVMIPWDILILLVGRVCLLVTIFGIYKRLLSGHDSLMICSVRYPTGIADRRADEIAIDGIQLTTQ